MRFFLLGLLAGAACIPAVLAAQEDAPEGDALFRLHCAACHQASGNGVPGMFPRVRGHVGELAADENGGRDYVLAVLVNGLTGPISVDGKTYSGYMPAFAKLPDAEIAAILNSLGVAPANHFTAAEVSAMRGRELSASDVGAMSPSKAGS